MFLLNSRLGLFTATTLVAPLLPKLRGYFAEFLNNASPVRLRILSSPTCVGLQYGYLHTSLRLFSSVWIMLLRYFKFRSPILDVRSGMWDVGFKLCFVALLKFSPLISRLSPLERDALFLSRAQLFLLRPRFAYNV